MRRWTVPGVQPILADAAPFFRIFNPARQAARFDPDGGYVGRWVSPGSASVPPIVDHDAARARALAALERMRRTETRTRSARER